MASPRTLSSPGSAGLEPTGLSLVSRCPGRGKVQQSQDRGVTHECPWAGLPHALGRPHCHTSEQRELSGQGPPSSRGWATWVQTPGCISHSPPPRTCQIWYETGTCRGLALSCWVHAGRGHTLQGCPVLAGDRLCFLPPWPVWPSDPRWCPQLLPMTGGAVSCSGACPCCDADPRQGKSSTLQGTGATRAAEGRGGHGPAKNKLGWAAILCQQAASTDRARHGKVFSITPNFQ